MSSIVTSILSTSVGLLWNKARDVAAKGLKDGDSFDAQMREIIVRDLNDIKTKLDGLSRKDLLSSYSFLQEGVQLLNAALDKSKDEQKAEYKTQDDRGETSTMPSGGKSDILNEAIELTNAIEKLKIVSIIEFESIKKRFEEARERATYAFYNESLSIADRILAAKLRVTSELLECLDNPNTAVTSCMFFLHKLHDLPAVCEIFSVFLRGGIKSLLGKSARAENVKSVMMINYVLYQFVSKFSSEHLYSALRWPEILLPDRSFNPICSWQEVSTRECWGGEFIQPPNELKLDEEIFPFKSVVNSRGEILVGYGNDIKVICRTGESKVVHQFSALTREDKEGKVIEQVIAGLAVDQKDNVYVVLYYEATSVNGNVDKYAVLYKLDEHCKHVIHESKFHFSFLKAHFSSLLTLAINKNNNIVMAPILLKDCHVYICDITGKLKYQFQPKYSPPYLGCVSVTDNNEIMLASFGNKAVDIYTEEGNLKLQIKLPADFCGLAFHFLIRKIIVLTKDREDDFCFLHCYSKNGELETSALCFKKNRSKFSPRITSHPSGPVAIVREEKITYI